MKTLFKKISLIVVCLCLALCLMSNGALACTLIYVGSAMSADGSVIFARSEDYSNSQNKLFYVAEAGKHKAGELYNGCYGFSYTFTHDSYSYTAFSDDNGAGVDGVCPDCGQEHAHTPYEAAGTNSMGLSVTATETISGCEAIEEVDPYEDLGIEEAEIVTVLLSEAANAKEALDILTGIYDTAGANAGSGIIVADANEAWYIENVSGHQYIALKLTDTLVMTQPNMVIIGLIDLDDTENVVASENLIATAQQANIFVGDAEQNQINYVMSYGGGTQANARMVNALAYLDAAYVDAAEIDPESSYVLSNVKDSAIVALYNGINPAEKLSIEDVQNFYHISNIGYQRNLEGHIFQITSDAATGTVEWVAINDNALSVFVPYYPMLTTDVYEGYKLSTAEASFVTEAPESGVYYPTTKTMRVDGERKAVDGFMVLPENWADSIYWVTDALSNTVLYCTGLEESEISAAYDSVYALQAKVNADFFALDPAAVDAESATQWSADQAKALHEAMLALANDVIK